MESEFLDWLRARLPASRWLRLGPGDDAAILRLGEAPEVVVTTDLLTDGVDFQIAQDEPRRIGRKALAVNLSDLAAMAAEPVAAVVSLALPRDGALPLACGLYEGLLPLAESFDVAIAGGDTNTWNGPLVVSVTALGRTTKRGPLIRGGARPGDWLLVTGQFGGSFLGHQFDFEPRVRESLLLAERYALRAGIDCSDGLARDASRMASASNCGVVIDPARVPIAADALRMAAHAGDGRSPLDHALYDGEDFELILAVEPDEAQRLLSDQPLGIAVTQIGHFTSDAGLWVSDPSGPLRPLTPGGYEH